jgi:hypothetical protein
MTEDGLLMYQDRVYIPNSIKLKRFIMDEIYKRPYSWNLGYKKMITTVRKLYYFPGMKKEIAKYIAKCIEYQQVKDEHRHQEGLLQPMPIPKWKWETMSMDVITRFLRTIEQHDAIMVVVDKLSKVAHFIPVNSTHKAIDVVEIFMKEISKLHGILKVIISNMDVKFI